MGVCYVIIQGPGVSQLQSGPYNVMCSGSMQLDYKWGSSGLKNRVPDGARLGTVKRGPARSPPQHRLGRVPCGPR